MTDFSVSGSHTIIGAVRFHGRVRDGVGWFPHAEGAKRKGVVGATQTDSQGGAGLKGGVGVGVEVEIEIEIEPAPEGGLGAQRLGVGGSSRTVD